MRLIDLSTPFDANFVVPQLPYSRDILNMTMVNNVVRDGHRTTKFTLLTHSGTHIDVPSHRFTREEKPEGFFYLEDVPMDWFHGEAVVLDIPKGELETIGAKDLEEAAQGDLAVREGDFVLVHTGWGKYFEEEHLRNWHYVFHNKPGLDVSGAEWLIEKKARAYGADTLGTQHPKYDFRISAAETAAGVPRVETEPVHDSLLFNDILLIEHMGHLDEVAGRRVGFGVFPLPLRGTDGAPARAVAFLEDE